MATESHIYQDLGISHPSEHVTCIGFNNRGKPCANRVAAGTRLAAADSLDSIGELTSGDTIPEGMVGDLELCAGQLFCKKYHQDQAEAKAEEWHEYLEEAILCRKIRLLQIETERQRGGESQLEAESQRESRSQSSNRASTPRHSPASHQDENIIAEQRRLIQSQSELLNSVKALLEKHKRRERSSRRVSQSPSVDRERPTSTSHDSDMGQQQEPQQQQEEEGLRSASEADEARESGESNTDGSHSPSPRSCSRSSVLPRSATGSSSSSHTPSTASSPTTTIAVAADSEIDCGICLSELTNRSVEWSCPACFQPTHVACFDKWMAHCLAHQVDVTCVYCRARIETSETETPDSST